jgi:thioredoxin-like negative regulator of GroEL
LVAKLIEQAKAEIPDFYFEEVDITERPEVAVKYRVMSVPAIALNGRLEFMGVPKEEELRRRLLAAIRGGDHA